MTLSESGNQKKESKSQITFQGQKTKEPFNIYVDKMRGGGGQKMYVFFQAQGMKTVTQGGREGQKMAKFSPRRFWMPPNHWTFSFTSKVLTEFTLLDIKVARDGNSNPSKFNPWSHRSLVQESMHLSGKFAK